MVAKPAASKPAPKPKIAKRPAPKDVPGWLDWVMIGFGENFAGVFEEIGIEDTGDFAELDEEGFGDLREALIAADADEADADKIIEAMKEPPAEEEEEEEDAEEDAAAKFMQGVAGDASSREQQKQNEAATGVQGLYRQRAARKKVQAKKSEVQAKKKKAADAKAKREKKKAEAEKKKAEAAAKKKAEAEAKAVGQTRDSTRLDSTRRSTHSHAAKYGADTTHTTQHHLRSLMLTSLSANLLPLHRLPKQRPRRTPRRRPRERRRRRRRSGHTRST